MCPRTTWCSISATAPTCSSRPGLQPPKTFEEFRTCAKALTKGDVYGFGMRGGAGGFDNWGPFVLGGGASFDKGGMVTREGAQGRTMVREPVPQDKVTPPSAPTDSFRQIIDAFKAGRTAMVIHHLTTANEMVQALGADKVGAVPVPHSPDGKGWTDLRRRIQRDLLDLQEQGRGLQVDLLVCPRPKAT